MKRPDDPRFRVFPTLCWGLLPLTLIVWVGAEVILTAITIGVGIFGRVSRSGWDIVAQIPRWYALFLGVALTWELLARFVAHGHTRREFAAQAGLFTAVAAAMMGLLMTIGFGLERLVYWLAGWPQNVGGKSLYTSADQYGLILLSFGLEFAVWMTAGSLVAAAFYRFEAGGVLAIPIGAAMVFASGSVLGMQLKLPFFTARLGIELGRSVGLAVAVCVASILLGAAITWAFVRDMPIRTKNA